MRVGFDIDGVLYPWADAAAEAAMDHFGLPDPRPMSYWSAYRETMGKTAWNWLWTAEGQNRTFEKAHLVHDGAITAVRSIGRMGHEVHFVTHRDPLRTAVHTAKFLRAHFSTFQWAGVHVVRNSVKKADLMEWDVFVDDKVETCLEMVEAGVGHVFAPARPWNEELADLGGRMGERFTRYTDFSQVTAYVAERS